MDADLGVYPTFTLIFSHTNLIDSVQRARSFRRHNRRPRTSGALSPALNNHRLRLAKVLLPGSAGNRLGTELFAWHLNRSRYSSVSKQVRHAPGHPSSKGHGPFFGTIKPAAVATRPADIPQLPSVANTWPPPEHMNTDVRPLISP